MAANKGWLKKLNALNKIIEENGPLWPRSTKLAGYGEEGPYHCEDCIYAKGKKQNDLFKDENGKGRCLHEAMIMDPEVKKDKSMLPIINLEVGCCEFVDQKGHKKD
jgi:hypothetical protein